MARVRLDDVHVVHEIFTSRDYNLKRHLVDAIRRRTGTRPAIQALSGVSLEIGEGARLGIVGANGAGKSTLLSVVAGMLPPTRGRINVEGRVLALLGGASTGLDQEASGRDNIITMGLQLGETPAAMRARIDEVTEFSGLSSRIDHAVHTYSTGMQARLRFSVLTSLRPDILVIDEGISTADAEFSERAGERLDEFLSSAGILVMASHSETLITQHCRSALWLDQGVVHASGDVDDVLAGYRAMYHHELPPAPHSEPVPAPVPAPGPEPEPVPEPAPAPQPIDPPVSARAAQAAGELPLGWSVEIPEYSYYRGRLRVVGRVVCAGAVDSILIGWPPWEQLTGLSIAWDSDVEGHFDVEVYIPQEDVGNAALLIRTADDDVFRVGDLGARASAEEPVRALFETFKRRVLETPGPTVLEVGSRQASGVDHIGWLPDDCRYLGVDVVDGPNVDLVVDAHRLSEALPRRYFDAAFSLATFEHLAMPWVVAVELNRVLRTGALVFVVAHRIWPLDAGEVDYFRFSEHSWAALFNRHSGFEICGVASGERVRIVANAAHAATLGLDAHPTFLTSAVLARKIGETDLRWEAPVAQPLLAPVHSLPPLASEGTGSDE